MQCLHAYQPAVQGNNKTLAVRSVVVDGRGLSAYSWGSSVILAGACIYKHGGLPFRAVVLALHHPGPGPSFHLAFGTRGFSSGSMASEIGADTPTDID